MTGRKKRQGGRSDEEEKTTRRKERQGGKSEEEEGARTREHPLYIIFERIIFIVTTGE